MRSAARWMLVTLDAQHGCSVVNDDTCSLMPSDCAHAVSRAGCERPRAALRCAAAGEDRRAERGEVEREPVLRRHDADRAVAVHDEAGVDGGTS